MSDPYKASLDRLLQGGEDRVLRLKGNGIRRLYVEQLTEAFDASPDARLALVPLDDWRELARQLDDNASYVDLAMETEGGSHVTGIQLNCFPTGPRYVVWDGETK